MRWQAMIGVMVTCVILAICAPARAAEPLTQAKIEQRRYDLLKPLLLDPYLADKGNEPWRAEGQELIEYVTWNMTYGDLSDWAGPRSAHDEQHAWKLAYKLILSDCKQPQVMIAATWVALGRGYSVSDYPESPKLDQAWNSNYVRQSPVLHHLMIQRMRTRYNAGYQRTFFAKFSIPDGWVSPALDAAASGYFKPEDRQIAVQILCDWAPKKSSAKARTAFIDGLSKRKGVDEYVKLAGTARLEDFLAWDARGEGYANTVTEEGGKSFEQHLTTEKELLEKAYALDPSVPFAPGKMVSVAMGLDGVNECTKWFTRTVDIQSDNDVAWQGYINAMRGRWHGNPEELMQIANTAAEETDFSTRTPWFYVQTLRFICTDGGLETVKNPKMLEELHRIIEGYRQTLPPGFAPELPDSTEAALSFLLEDYATCAKDMAKVGDKLDRNEFTRHEILVDPEFARRKSAAMISPWADRIKPITNLANQGQQAAAIKAAEALLKEKAPDELTRQYVAFLREGNRFLLSYNAGKITPILDNPDAFTCWTVTDGTVQPEADGKITLKAPVEESDVRLYYRLLNSDNYIFRGRIRVNNVGHDTLCRWNMIFRGYPNDPGADLKFGKASFGDGNMWIDPNTRTSSDYAFTKDMTFEAIIRDDTITLKMDGKEVVKNQHIYNEPLVGIRCLTLDPRSPSTISFEDLTLQKLP